MIECKNCENYIFWECEIQGVEQPCPCESCKLQEQSYNIDFTNCPIAKITPPTTEEENIPELSLPMNIKNQSGKEITHNEALVIIDALLNNGIIDKDLSTPLKSPNNGDCYIVNSNATGNWKNHENEIAFYNNGWRFVSPNKGLTIWVNDENLLYSYNGTSWVQSGGEGLIYSLDDLMIRNLTGIEIVITKEEK